MEDMYNNQDNQYQNDPYQNNIQQQLQYQYQEPKTELEEPMTFGEWMITMLIMLIPCANIIMMFVWAFGSNVKKSKSNYFKATLVFWAIGIVLYIILFAAMGASIMNMMNSGVYY